MKPVRRAIQAQLLKAARGFSALVLTGPRRAGKTYCLRQAFPRHSYHLLEDPDELARVKADPRAWLEALELPVILDEVQNTPEIFPFIRAAIDRASASKGRFILTGSHDFSLMKGVSESMAGRAAIFHLYPLGYSELRKWDLIRGGFPEIWARPKQLRTWFQSYVQTYLERDVRGVLAVRDLSTFRRFLGLVAIQNGQMLNKTALAAPLGVSVPTVSEWLGVLETTGLILLVPPYYENFKKRLVKSPKLYWTDTGLLCALMNISSMRDLEASPFVGSTFESFVASEVVKAQAGRGLARELYYFRDHQGLEVDFIVPAKGGSLALVEAKWTKTPTPSMASPLRSIEANSSKPVRSFVVHRPSPSLPSSVALGGGVRAVPVEEFLSWVAEGTL